MYEAVACWDDRPTAVSLSCKPENLFEIFYLISGWPWTGNLITSTFIPHLQWGGRLVRKPVRFAVSRSCSDAEPIYLSGGHMCNFSEHQICFFFKAFTQDHLWTSHVPPCLGSIFIFILSIILTGDPVIPLTGKFCTCLEPILHALFLPTEASLEMAGLVSS